MCGANSLPASPASSQYGSSPRVRGERRASRRDLARGRIIPACAGRTVLPDDIALPTADHPRVCGANAGRVWTYLQPRGSSPRVRGEPGRQGRRVQRRQRVHHHRQRIIPACAGRTSATPSASSTPPDHPRVCGANAALAAALVSLVGSSPRVRGEPNHRNFPRPNFRIIPACAGRTSQQPHGPPPWPDHPRACGANIHRRGRGSVNDGSSPRVRGELQSWFISQITSRIIPARAGRTRLRFCRGCGRPDHPRACGANDWVREFKEISDGSSPRVRGEQNAIVQLVLKLRIIPARAGRTTTTSNSTCAASDHPRACGANPFRVSHRAVTPGSSPRVRGELDKKVSDAKAARIIPARAGRTTSPTGSPPPATDHPRACGANPAVWVSIMATLGSSPRVRGERRGEDLHGRGGRIIPACAGRTNDHTTRHFTPSDHPRVCGANVRRFLTGWADPGSSPRVRGERSPSPPSLLALRIIPACAGRTRCRST